MKIGILTTEFAPHGAFALFSKVSSLGFETVQFAFESVTESGFMPDGRIEMPPSISPGLAAKIASAAAANGVSVSACSGTFNMAHPDPGIRAEGLRRLDGLASAAKELGTGIITLCSGTRNEGHLWTRHHDNGAEETWSDMIETMLRAADIAERRGIVLAVETEYNNVIDTPEKARRMLDTVNSPRLGMVMDCANLFHPGDARKDNAACVMENAFSLIGGSVVLAHGKDITESDGIRFCPTGEGIIDYRLFISLLDRYQFKGDMILHGIYDEVKIRSGLAVINEALRHHPNNS